MYNFDSIIALLTLTSMEIVLGIDNIIFLSIIVGRLPKNKQKHARNLGLILALFFRISLLFAISWLTSLTAGLFSIRSFDVSGRDLVMLLGGLFLIGKSTTEIHHKLESIDDEDNNQIKKNPSLLNVISQVIVIDVVFSLDSIITAVGLVNNISIMITAVIISMIIMMIFSGKISDFINHHPTMKILALSFLIMVGVMLVADGLHFHIPKGYIYFAMAFSFMVEIVNMKIRKTVK